MPIRRAFSLIELLVTIAIIAILLSILTPALGKARDAARLAVSMSNLRQIQTGIASYGHDHRQTAPIYEMTKRPSYDHYARGRGWATWTFGGTYCDPYWFGRFSGRYDVWPYERPLNPYLYPDAPYFEPASFAAGPTDEERESLELPIFKSPGDQFTRQRQGAVRYQRDYSFDGGSYEDVGTSYHFNLKWYRRLQELGWPTWNVQKRHDPAFEEGLRRIRLASDFDPTTFVLVHDQTADTVAHSTLDDKRVEGEFGDINKSALAFLDGHVEYLDVEPNAFETDEYTYVFPLRGDEALDGD